jgi:hypothetical protein
VRLNEFANMKKLRVAGRGDRAILKQIERIWRDHGIDDDGPFIARLEKRPIDKPAS